MNTQLGRLARQQARRQRRERLAGAAVVALGIAVAVIAVIALREPGGHVSGTAAARTVVVTSARPSSAGASSPAHPASSAASHAGSASGASGSTSATTSSAGSSSATTAGTGRAPLIVLNNTTTGGLAQQAAQRFGSGGWTVTRYGNLPGNITDVISTCAYYDPSSPGAKAAAQALQRQYPVIKRVKRRFSDLPAGPVVVVLTPDYLSG